jgi:hypothetical protein
MVNDEEAIMVELNHLCGTKHNIFYNVRMSKKRLPMQASTFGVGTEEALREDGKEVGHEGIDGSIRLPILLKEKFL